jgi:hypothetical protein
MKEERTRELKEKMGKTKFARRQRIRHQMNVKTSLLLFPYGLHLHVDVHANVRNNS